MRVFDRSCETVESAGSRRGAQMGVLRCDHPDIEAFIHAKDQGDLRNFNISVGVTDAFMEAVQADGVVELVAQGPAQRGRRSRPAPTSAATACGSTARSAPASLWDQVMRSTYDHAEPGVLFLDRINDDNNLHYCETIAATNPCVTAETWTLTSEGPRQVRELIGKPFHAIVDGKAYATESTGFFATGVKPVLRLSTREGHELRLTGDHPVRRVTRKTRYLVEAEWKPAVDVRPGDELMLHDHRALQGWDGPRSEAEGYLLGLLIGDGALEADKAVLSVWAPELKAVGSDVSHRSESVDSVMRAAETAMRTAIVSRSDFKGWQRPIAGRGEFQLASTGLRDLAGALGATPGHKRVTPAMEATSSDFHRGLLRGLFDAHGSVQGAQDKGVSIRLTQVDVAQLQAAQRMLARLGIAATIYRDRETAGLHRMADGRGGTCDDERQSVQELVISGDNLRRYAEQVGFEDCAKQSRLDELLGAYRRELNRERFTATVAAIEPDGVQAVYDVTVEHVHAFDANGLYVHNCAEQPLPPYGCCCLGSIDLTRFVRDPFSAKAEPSTKPALPRSSPLLRAMLDNVLDVTPWPLPAQAQEACEQAPRGPGLHRPGRRPRHAQPALRHAGCARDGRPHQRGPARRGLRRIQRPRSRARQLPALQRRPLSVRRQLRLAPAARP